MRHSSHGRVSERPSGPLPHPGRTLSAVERDTSRAALGTPDQKLFRSTSCASTAGGARFSSASASGPTGASNFCSSDETKSANMKSLRIAALLLLLLSGTLADNGFDLSDALGDPEPTQAKQPKAPENPKTEGGLDLFDAFGPDEPTAKPKPKKPSSGDSGSFGLDLEDALGPDPNPKPEKPAVNPPKSGGGGGTFGDSDLIDVSGGDYKPDGGRSGGDRSVDPGHDPQGGADQPQEAGSGQIAGIASAIGVALLGAASSYFAYQKKKLCFKLQGGADPESGKGHHGTQSDPQVFSNLLRTS